MAVAVVAGGWAASGERRRAGPGLHVLRPYAFHKQPGQSVGILYTRTWTTIEGTSCYGSMASSEAHDSSCLSVLSSEGAEGLCYCRGGVLLQQEQMPSRETGNGGSASSTRPMRVC